ncbi:hypothetical protein [Streptomyces sp. NPDC048192]|uniref:hypothetical protein n=1 Tax=Streptomyces sp. NPDC048192 TaxID=3365510 RepID=UPI00371C808D
MEPLPTPCPAELIPDASATAAYNAAYKAAKEQHAVFVAIECQAQRWTVKPDALTAPAHAISNAVYDAICRATLHLIRSREIRPDSSCGPVYFAWYDLEHEHRARELAAALHAALYGNLGPLAQAVPHTPA